MKKTRLWIIIGAIALVVVAIAVALIVDVSTNKETVKRCEHSITYFYEDAAGSTRFFCDGKLLEHQIAGAVDSFLSCDGTVCIVRAATGLYRVDENEVLLIYPAGVERAALSLDNSVIVFTTATMLHVYDHTTGELTDLQLEDLTGIPSIAVSNDGSTVAYTKKTKDGVYELYSYINNESKKLKDGAYVLAVSKDAKRVWYMDPSDSSLYFMQNGHSKKAAENVSGLVEFNRDLSEAVFDVSGETRFSNKGSKAAALVEGASVYTTKPECASTQGGAEAAGSVADCSTLFNCVFYSTLTTSDSSGSEKAYNLYYINKLHHVKTLAKGTTGFSISSDGKTLGLLIDNDLYKMDSDEPATAVKLVDKTYSFRMTRDGKGFYAIGTGLGLYYVEQGTNAIQLATNTTYCVLTLGGNCLFISDYGSDGGTLGIAKGHNPVSTVMDGVSMAEVKPGVVFCYSSVYENEYGSSVYDVYTSTDGIEFTLALKGARRQNEE